MFAFLTRVSISAIGSLIVIDCCLLSDFYILPASFTNARDLAFISKKEIAEILKSEGFIKNVEYVEDDKQGVIRLFLKYGQNNERVITGLKRISKPGLRVYAKANEVPKVLNGLGIAVITPSEVDTNAIPKPLSTFGTSFAFA